MSVEELRKEIQSLSPEQLKSVEGFIKKINAISSEEWDLKEHVENIMQREDVLQKLAK